MTDQELIAVCTKRIEKKFDLPANGSWKERDFQYLSELLFEKTQTRLSVSTLKRIWKERGDRSPQLYTLNAMARLLGVESWIEFKRLETAGSVDSPTQVQVVKPKPLRNIIYWIAIIVLLSIVIVWLAFPGSFHPKYDPGSIVFKSRKNLTSGVPNTVVFEYDISKAEFDSAFIQHTWDRRIRERVTKENNTQTFIYYYPGYHTAKLTLDTTVVKQERVNISTDGWVALVDNNIPGQVPLYISKKDIISNGSLYVGRELISQNDITAEGKEFYVNYFNVGNFNALDGNNFTLETRLRNSLEEGALVCQYVQLNLICENSLFSIPFCNPGCAANIHLHTSDVFRDGKKSDLSAFGIDLSDWRDITVKRVNKKLTILVDNRPVYTVEFTRDPGKITGMHYKFAGCGRVDNVRLYNGGNELVYTEDFNNSQ
jgi:hypothetical protein